MIDKWVIRVEAVNAEGELVGGKAVEIVDRKEMWNLEANTHINFIDHAFETLRESVKEIRRENLPSIPEDSEILDEKVG